MTEHPMHDGHCTTHHRHGQHGEGCGALGGHLHRPRQGRALWWCLGLTHAAMLIELVAGYLTNSLMLISDGVHMSLHAVSMGVSLLAILLARRGSSARFPYGWHRVEIVAAQFNGLLLLGLSGWIIWEAIARLRSPLSIDPAQLIWVALFGLVVNLVTALILHQGGTEDLNTRSAFLHLLADLISSVAIVVGCAVMAWTQWYIIDPLLSLLVAALTLKWSLDLLGQSLRILLQGAPRSTSAAAVEAQLKEAVPAIRRVSEVRIWELTSGFVCCSARIWLEDMPFRESTFLCRRAEAWLWEHLGMGHVVIQAEMYGAEE